MLVVGRNEDTVRDDVEDDTNPNETETCNNNDAATRATVEGYTIILFGLQ